MKILLVSPTVNLNGGGISSYAQDFFKAFGTDFDIVVVSSEDLEEGGLICEKYYRKIVLTDLSRSNALLLLSLIREELPDIIVNSDSPLLAIIIPFISSEVKVISVSHFVDGLLADIAGFNGRYLNSLISLSTYGKEYLSKWADKDKIAVIPNYYEPIEEENQFIKKENDIPVIVYPGGSSLHKNPFFVFKLVYKLLKTDLPFRFYWLGNDTLPLAFTFKKKRISENVILDNRLVFTGRISRNDAVKIISNANIFLLPSTGEGFPISLLEAMSSGTISIVSDAKHGSLDIVKNGYNGFVISSKDPNIAFVLVKDILFNPRKYDCIYENSLKVFNEEYSCETWKRKMKEAMLTDLFVKRNFVFSYSAYHKQRIFFKIYYFKNRLLMMWRSLCLCFKFHLN